MDGDISLKALPAQQGYQYVPFFHMASSGEYIYVSYSDFAAMGHICT